MKQAIWLWVEPSYHQSSWYEEILRGLASEAAKRDIRIAEMQAGDLEALPPREQVVLLGSSSVFVTSALSACSRQGLRPLIAGFEFDRPQCDISYVTTDRRRAMREMVCYLYGCGARKIALLGTNSAVPTDVQRFRGWAEAVCRLGIGDGLSGAYPADSGVKTCVSAFFSHHRQYDAVACTNDYFAVYLLGRLRESGVRVPETLMVTGFGDITVGRHTKPPLTTVALNLEELGRQAFFIWRDLHSNDKILTSLASVDCSIVVRETTRPLREKPPTLAAMPPAEGAIAHCTLLERELQPISLLEKTLCQGDATLQAMLRGIALDVPYEKLAEQLYLSNTAFQYRLHKLYEATGVSGRNALKALVVRFLPALSGESTD